MGPMQLAQRLATRRILRPDQATAKPVIGDSERSPDHVAADHPAPTISGITSGALGDEAPIQKSDNEEPEEELQRQTEEGEEESIQTRLIQRQPDDEEEESVQAKLTIGQPDDKYEQEADRVADQVVAMPDARLQRQPENEEAENTVQAKPQDNQITPLVQRQEDALEEEETPVQTSLVQRETADEEDESIQTKLIQREVEEEAEEEEQIQTRLIQRQTEEEEEGEVQAEGSIPSAQAASRAVNSHSSGSPIRPDVRGILESGIGADLSSVRVHEDSAAQEAAASINAKAFTHKNDIWLGAGQSQSDLHLMAHETTHVVQQGAAVRTTPAGISQTPARVQRLWNPLTAVANVVSDAVEWVGDSIGDAVNYIKEKASEFVRSMPGYSLFTVVIGSDPITGQTVDRNGRNFIEAGLDVIPNGDALKQKLEEEGALEEAAQYLDEQIAELDISPTEIGAQLSAFWSSLGIADATRLPTVMDRLLNIIRGPVERIGRFAVNVASQLLQIVKDYLVSSLIDFIREQTTAYPLLTVILERDPISGEAVERTPIALLRGFMLLSESGAEQLRQMEESGSLQKAADWLDGAVARLNLSWEELVSGFMSIWNSVGIHSLLDPVGIFRQIYDTFAAPVGRIINFVIEVGTMILRFIKDALIRRLVAYARTIRGYPLLTVILGQDPFSDEPVERSAENIIHGFMSLMDGGEEQFQEMKQTGAIARLTTRIENAIATLNFTWEYIKGLFVRAWESFSLADLAAPIAAFQRLMGIFGAPLLRLVSFVGDVIKLVIEVALQLMNFPVSLISNIITKAMQAFEDIKRDPIGFLKNLLRAVKTGFVKFFDNIATHLINGVTGWLFKELEDAGIRPPADLSLGSILGFVMDVLGISIDRIFQKLAARIGQDKVDRIRGMIGRLTGIWTFVSDVMTRGPVAIWEYIRDQISNLWNVVLDAVRNWVVTRIVQRVVARLLSMLDPTGIMAVVNGFIAFYNAVQSFIAYLREMLEIVNSFVEGVAEIARGSVERAANFLEGSLARAVPIAIGFLANQVGLSGLGRRIGEMIERVREMVDRGLDWLIDRAVSAGTSFMNMFRGGRGDEQESEHSPEKQAQIDAGLDSIQTEEARHAQNGKITREDAQRVAASIRQDHSVFSSFDVIDGGDSWDYRYTASPAETVDTQNTTKADDEESQQDLINIVPLEAKRYEAESPDGRAQRSHGHITDLKDAERESLPAIGRLAGGSIGYQPGDHRGHLIGDRFHGAATRANLVPMHQTLNLSTFKTYENTLAGTLRDYKERGKAVLLYMNITPSYSSTDPDRTESYRPASVSVAGTKVITLKENSTQPEAQEDPIPGGPFPNPEPGVVRQPIVRLNSASQEDIASLSGIGDILAVRIWDFIQTNGPIARYSQLDQVAGIGSRTMEVMRNDPLKPVRL